LVGECDNLLPLQRTTVRDYDLRDVLDKAPLYIHWKDLEGN
jgi:hypothetical protein